MSQKSVLFLCTGNSCRSQMAEGLVNHDLLQEWIAFSAGTEPSGFVHPMAIQVMKEIDIDITGQKSKSTEAFRRQHLDLVITVCDDAAQDCPVWLGEGATLHIAFPDPAKATGTEEERIDVFRRVRDDIRRRISFFLNSGRLLDSLSSGVRLRDVTEDDLPILFEQQLDQAANYMAAFTAKDPADRDAFMAHWTKILADNSITKKSILLAGSVAGHVVSFERLGEPEVAYWIGKEYWGQGLATEALAKFLADLKTRPLYARAAADNVASIRVLQKNGFTNIGREKFFANARDEEIVELIMKLE